MDWQTFILECVRALAWPVAVVITAIVVSKAYSDSFEDEDD